MKKKKIISTVLLAMAGSAGAFTVEWDKIVYWSGEGDNKAALVVQFNDGKEEVAYVWGYRWPKGKEVSGEDMFRAVAASSPDLYLFTQYTGTMGSTVDGIGYSRNQTVAGNIAYDFIGAKDDPRVSFNYFTPNSTMNQTEAPGWDTQEICEAAIEASKETHILEHPINARRYGYPAYDYDHWQMTDPDDPEQRWNAGWYDGYWSYWVSDGETQPDSDNFGYSGLGMTSRKLSDGSVDAWKFLNLDGPVVYKPGRQPRKIATTDGTTGATADWYSLDYEHFGIDTGVEAAAADNDDIPGAVYRLDGTTVMKIGKGVSLGDVAASLSPGAYIIVKGSKRIRLVK